MQYKRVTLKLANSQDAEFIASLRSDSVLNKHLSSNRPITATEQLEWLVQNQKNTNDLYYTIRFDDIPCGTVSIYNIDTNQKRAEFGRFISLNPISALTAELLIIRHAFSNLMIDELYCRTILENTKVWKQHYRFGFKDSGTEALADGRILKVQTINKNYYMNFDYNDIISVIDKFIERI